MNFFNIIVNRWRFRWLSLVNFCLDNLTLCLDNRPLQENMLYKAYRDLKRNFSVTLHAKMALSDFNGTLENYLINNGKIFDI